MRINYRKIYERHYGPIPKDASGRAYEVHHVDGDHTNNNITNLKLVTIEEHYAIHKAQEDWAACFAMAQRLKLSVTEISEMASKNALARGKAGTLPAQIAVKNGTFHSQISAKKGTHHWNVAAKNGTHPAQIASKSGTHHWQIAAQNGTHPAQGNNDINSQLLANGQHASQIKVTCLRCKRTTASNSFVRNHIKATCRL